MKILKKFDHKKLNSYFNESQPQNLRSSKLRTSLSKSSISKSRSRSRSASRSQSRSASRITVTHDLSQSTYKPNHLWNYNRNSTITHQHSQLHSKSKVLSDHRERSSRTLKPTSASKKMAGSRSETRSNISESDVMRLKLHKFFLTWLSRSNNLRKNARIIYVRNLKRRIYRRIQMYTYA